MKQTTLVILSFLLWGELLSQLPEIGNLFVKNYFRTSYGANAQNHDIIVDENGIVYSANNDGLLTYNGERWRKLSLPNKTIARALHIRAGKRIYVGGQDEIGYFSTRMHGKPIFTSIKEQIPRSDRSFSDVWNILEINGYIAFCSENKLYICDETDCMVYSHDRLINNIHKAGGELMFSDRTSLFRLDLNDLKAELIRAWPNGIDINRILEETNGNIYLFTSRNGVYSKKINEDLQEVDWPINARLKGKLINDACFLNNGYIAIGTGLEGLFVLDQNGELVHHEVRSKGLQNNSILCLTADLDGNLWLGLSDGISYVEVNTAFTKLYPDGNLQGAAYDVLVDDNTLLVGTNNGLFQTPWLSNDQRLSATGFSPVVGSNGQVWNISKVQDDIILNHNDGCFLVESGVAKPISTDLGSWKWIEIDETHAIEGNYEGLALFQKANGRWKKVRQYKNFSEVARVMILDKSSNLWISHPYRGLFKITLSPDYGQIKIETYGSNKGLPGITDLYVFDINGIAYVTHPSGIYKYESETDQFVLDPILDEHLGNYSVRYLSMQEDESIWFTGDGISGILEVEDNGLSKEIEVKEIPGISQNIVAGFERIYPLNNQYTFICAQNGVLLHNDNNRRSQRDLSVHIIEISGGLADTILYDQYFGTPDSIMDINLPYNGNRFMLQVASGEQHHLNPFTYAYNLNDFDTDWSGWTTNTIKEYTNLPPGAYQMKVRVRDALGNIGNSKSINIIVGRPWYQTYWAIGMYLISFSCIVLLISWLVYKRTKRVRSNLEEEKAQTERQLVRVQNEKLAADIAYKNRELASVTMHLLQKSETISKLKEEIDKISKNVKDRTAKKEIKKAIELFNNDMRLEDDWEYFSRSFDKVHSNFLSRLREVYPELSAKDQKLCAYLRMNLTTKEIAPLMNISVRGVEIGRYRLRKKLNLDTTVNLNKFMMKF